MDSPPPASPAVTVPLAVAWRDDSSPFAVDATVTGWRRDTASVQGPAITLTIGAGTLRDADRGSFPLDGLELAILVARDRFEPIAVLNPGVLSEFQQEGLLDAVTSYLNGMSSPPRAPGGPR